MIFLSKNGTDEYVNMFAEGCKSKPTSDKTFNYDETAPQPIVLRGILKHKIMKQCWEDERDFYYMDSGYLGNYKSPINPNGWKWFHRIVKNDLQHNTIIDRPSDRWEALKYKIPSWKICSIIKVNSFACGLPEIVRQNIIKQRPTVSNVFKAPRPTKRK